MVSRKTLVGGESCSKPHPKRKGGEMKTSRQLLNKLLEEVDERLFRFIGIDNKGFVSFKIGLSAAHTVTQKAVCLNCGARASGEKAEEWRLGHVGCPKSKGYYLRNGFTADDLIEFIHSEIRRAVKEVSNTVLKEKEKNEDK
jgi:ribosomal protein L40E